MLGNGGGCRLTSSEFQDDTSVIWYWVTYTADSSLLYAASLTLLYSFLVIEFRQIAACVVQSVCRCES